MRFAEIYKKERAVFSLEFFPPRDPALLESTLGLIASLAKLAPDFMTCTYGAGGGTRALTRQIVSYMHNQLGATSVAHLTCVGHSVSELTTILEQLEGEGVKNVLALRGDPPKGSSGFEAHPEGLTNAKELVALINNNFEFSVAVAGYPEGHREAISPESEINYLKEKVDTGAEVVFTQLFFDVRLFNRFRERAVKAGISVPIVPGIMPLSSASQLGRFEDLFHVSVPSVVKNRALSLRDDPQGLLQFGIDYALEMADDLLRSGAPGIHLYTLNKSTQAEPILRALKAT